MTQVPIKKDGEEEPYAVYTYASIGGVQFLFTEAQLRVAEERAKRNKLFLPKQGIIRRISNVFWG